MAVGGVKISPPLCAVAPPGEFRYNFTNPNLGGGAISGNWGTSKIEDHLDQRFVDALMM